MQIIWSVASLSREPCSVCPHYRMRWRQIVLTCAHTNWSRSSSDGGVCRPKWKISSKRYCLIIFYYGQKWFYSKFCFIGQHSYQFPLIFFLFFFLFIARKAYFYKLPPPALLLDWQMGGFDHGGHSADGGGDPKRAWGGNLSGTAQLSCHYATRGPYCLVPAAGIECILDYRCSNESHIRCVRREMCEGPQRQTSRGPSL